MSDIVELTDELSDSDLYSDDLAPVPASGRTWNLWNITAIWVGMAVCIPTYMLAADMVKSGAGWAVALLIILLANIIVAIPMIFNGHAGVKYGIPFPVLARSAFGTVGVHIPALARALVACGWFGIQTWIGGKAFYAIYCAIIGEVPGDGAILGNFVGFGLFWLLNLYFIWKGTESIRWLETFSAPILILLGVALIIWGAASAGGIGTVLEQSKQMQRPTATLVGDPAGLRLQPLRDLDGRTKARDFRVAAGADGIDAAGWNSIPATGFDYPLADLGLDPKAATVSVQFRAEEALSSVVTAVPQAAKSGLGLWAYIAMLTGMVGFWATMSISISDITRYATSQKEQALGQFLGLPWAMLLYSFVGVFVTCAALILFSNTLTAEDAPWDPVSLISQFKNPWIVIPAQIAMVIATLSTNIAANVIAPANAFANAFPKKISFAMGGLITGIIGILVSPWWLIGRIIPMLLLVSACLGPVLGVMLSDYFLVRGKNLDLAGLYRSDGPYRYRNGFNMAGMIALFVGVGLALLGNFVPAVKFLYDLSWFLGFFVSFVLYFLLMGRQESATKA